MRSYIAFTKKEFTESIRTYKLLIIFAVFLLFGMLNPITAKITPKLLSSFMPEGMMITITDPSAIDSWMQFYKNMTGLQMIVFVIVFSGIVSSELSKGTLVPMLTKGLSRKTVIFSKFTSAAVLWTINYLICFGTTFIYTLYLLPGELSNLFFSAFCMWLFGVMIITVMLAGSVAFGNIYGTLLTAGGFSVLLMLLNIVPGFQKYNPNLLSSGNVSLLTSDMTVSDFTVSIVIAIVIIFLSLTSAIARFNKRQL